MLRTIIVAGAVLVALPFVGFLAFVVWRWTSTERGIREVDELILRELDPICELGLAGPYFADDKPYDNQALGFSSEGKTEPVSLSVWYVGVRDEAFHGQR